MKEIREGRKGCEGKRKGRRERKRRGTPREMPDRRKRKGRAKRWR